MTVAALFVDTSEHGIYPKLLGAEACWGEERDARTYAGSDPVVAHPPCQLWVNMAAMNYARARREHARGVTNRRIILPAWYKGGSDGGCFRSALESLRERGGVLEHPAGSKAWNAEALARPPEWGGWGVCTEDGARGRWEYWVCEVWQSAYGHLARKKTWLVYRSRVGRPPFELNWSREPGTHQVGWFDRNKPSLRKRETCASPPAFARELIRLAEWSRGPL